MCFGGENRSLDQLSYRRRIVLQGQKSLLKYLSPRTKVIRTARTVGEGKPLAGTFEPTACANNNNTQRTTRIHRSGQKMTAPKTVIPLSARCPYFRCLRSKQISIVEFLMVSERFVRINEWVYVLSLWYRDSVKYVISFVLSVPTPV